MKEIIDELEKKFKEYCNLENDYQKAMDMLAHLDFDNKSNVIDDLREKRNNVDTRMHEYFNAIQALRKVCPHTNSEGGTAFHHSGHDSHYSYEKCGICGEERKT
jgi:uncharacterized coiled-coil DUF342 family protein